MSAYSATDFETGVPAPWPAWSSVPGRPERPTARPPCSQSVRRVTIAGKRSGLRQLDQTAGSAQGVLAEFFGEQTKPFAAKFGARDVRIGRAR